MAATNPIAVANKTAAAPAKTKGPATTEAKTPEGKACSAKADAQGLHGAARKAFRAKCKDAAKSAEKTGDAAAAASKKS
jgi:hypothetical protein